MRKAFIALIVIQLFAVTAGAHAPDEAKAVKDINLRFQVLLYKLVEDGSGYKTDDLGPLLTSSSNAFRPLGVQTGPDGVVPPDGHGSRRATCC